MGKGKTFVVRIAMARLWAPLVPVVGGRPNGRQSLRPTPWIQLQKFGGQQGRFVFFEFSNEKPRYSVSDASGSFEVAVRFRRVQKTPAVSEGRGKDVIEPMGVRWSEMGV